MNGSAWPFPMPCKVLDRVQQLWRLQNFCSQLVLALCRDSERIRDPSAGVAAAVDDALSLTQAERRHREMQRPVKLCESKFWNLCPMKLFFSWILGVRHGLNVCLTFWAHYKNVFNNSSSLKPGWPTACQARKWWNWIVDREQLSRATSCHFGPAYGERRRQLVKFFARADRHLRISILSSTSSF